MTTSTIVNDAVVNTITSGDVISFSGATNDNPVLLNFAEKLVTGLIFSAGMLLF